MRGAPACSNMLGRFELVSGSPGAQCVWCQHACGFQRASTCCHLCLHASACRRVTWTWMRASGAAVWLCERWGAREGGGLSRLLWCCKRRASVAHNSGLLVSSAAAGQAEGRSRQEKQGGEDGVRSMHPTNAIPAPAAATEPQVLHWKHWADASTLQSALHSTPSHLAPKTLCSCHRAPGAATEALGRQREEAGRA